MTFSDTRLFLQKQQLGLWFWLSSFRWTARILVFALAIVFAFAFLQLHAQDISEETSDNDTALTGFGLDEEELITLEEMRTLIGTGFSSYETLQADFKELFAGKLRQGKLFIEKPASLRLTYYIRDRIDMDVYGSHERLYVYLPAYRIVYEETFLDPESAELYTIQGASLETLFELYQFSFAETEELVPVLSEGEVTAFNVLPTEVEDLSLTYALLLTPKDITRGLDTLTLWVDESGTILRSRSRSIDQKIVDLYFHDIVLNEEIPAQTFELILEPTVKVLKNALP